jgi:S1-C subfamily serine protease
MDSAEPVKFKALGFSVAPLTKEQRKDYETEQGVLVTEVDNRGSVARRGLRPNSVILKADGKPVNSPGELKQILSTKNTGDGVLFVVKDKDGSKMAVTIEVPEDKS